ncbi:hypothetical protein [Halobellus ordinarius]|uniref:hypothetical protein n=1 Tax=Halobellus ordinarius TaxID=3075120 RepID=UPI0028806BB4|nr:hypothetical protein [Halobellus sp. ZY16]
MGTRLTHVSFDIETAGFETTDRVTVIGFTVPLGCRVFLNTTGRPVNDTELESTLGDRFETNLQLSTHDDESALLSAVAGFVAETVAPREFLLVAYNGERFNGGFDLPFLRTRYAQQDLAWPFDGLPYADILPLIQDRFNTTVAGDEQNDLVSAYDTLIGGDLGADDPFDESSEAVTAFESGAFESLVAHNLADILRTNALASLAEQYCGTSEFNLKSLTPSVRDPNLSSPDTPGP